MRSASLPSVCLVAFVSCVASVSFVSRASAQGDDTIGARAQGMGGAFTAVADDATASWWNPAGLAGGAYFNALIEAGSHREPSTERTPAGDLQNAWRSDTRGIAIAYPALGLSYYRLRVSEIQPQTSTAITTGVRQDEGAADVRLRSMTLDQLGATVGQSLGKYLVVGSTITLVTAGAASDVQAASTSSLDAAASLQADRETRVGVDVGAMATFGRVRVGLMVRNLREPSFGSGVDAFTLSRHARVGAALTSGTRGMIGRATVAFDADLTRTPTVLGDERHVAAGGEVWTTARTFGIRGGVSANTIGSLRTAFSGGLSAALKKGLYADGQITGGPDESRRGWGVALRVTF
jgi:hypothetical protein